VAENIHGDGRSRPACPVTVQGATTAPTRFQAQGPLHLFGMGLLPGGWAQLLRLPADSLTDDSVDLAAVLGDARVSRLWLAMAEAADDAARAAVADAFFTGLLAEGQAPAMWFARLAAAFLTTAPTPGIEVLVAGSGMSARSVERLARQLYGASPKLLARKYRALGAAVRLGTGEARDWADAAGDAFYDQAHFIREFKQFTGMTPTRFMAEAAPVTRLTIARRRLMPDLPPLALIS
jgi:AraC-like DNA-binding protein